MITKVSLNAASGSRVEEEGRPRAPPPKPMPWVRPSSDPPQGGPTSSWPQLSQWRCLRPPLLQPAGRPDGKVEEHNWAQLGFPGAQAGAPEARKLGPGAGAAPEKQQPQPGLQQWLPGGVPDWESPARCRVRPSSSALWLAWARAGRSRPARAPGSGVQCRRDAGAGCHPRRRPSTARKEEQELRRTSPERVRDSSGHWPRVS